MFSPVETINSSNPFYLLVWKSGQMYAQFKFKRISCILRNVCRTRQHIHQTQTQSLVQFVVWLGKTSTVWTIHAQSPAVNWKDCVHCAERPSDIDCGRMHKYQTDAVYVESFVDQKQQGAATCIWSQHLWIFTTLMRASWICGKHNRIYDQECMSRKVCSDFTFPSSSYFITLRGGSPQNADKYEEHS